MARKQFTKTCPHCDKIFQTVDLRHRFCSKSCGASAQQGTIEQRFRGCVVPNGADGCWGWTGTVGSDGYGQLGVRGKVRGAHRVSWELHHGPIPSGLHVLHHCDNPPCVNPAHLFLGTQADNMADKAKKGRHGHGASRGEAHGAAKLTEAHVVEIRSATGIQKDIATRFGVSNVTVSKIIRRKAWAHIGVQTFGGAE